MGMLEHHKKCVGKTGNQNRFPFELLTSISKVDASQIETDNFQTFTLN
jgi:hypothetical protein